MSQHRRLRIIPMLLVSVLVSMGYWGWRQLTKPNALPFRHIQIVSEQAHLASPKLEKIAWENLQGGFFTLHVEQLKQALLAIPWVANVSLRRHWPSTLSITVTEQQPVARWGKKGVMNTQGDVFYPSPNSIPNTLPILNGPTGEGKAMLSNYQKIREGAHLLGLDIKALDVSPRLSYRVILNNGLLIVIGRREVVGRFDRFVQLYPRLIGKNSEQIIRVDLRYPNGIAIKREKKQ